MKSLIDLYNESFSNLISEGLYDPAIFKAIFMAGGSGSGKSYVAKRTMRGHGLKYINSDSAFEYLLDKAGMSHDMNDPNNDRNQWDTLRNKAKGWTATSLDNHIDGRLGLVIDGTAAKHEKILKMKQRLEDLGYDTRMVFVNTSFAVAWERNQQRERSLDYEVVKAAHGGVQKSLPIYKKAFGEDFTEIMNNNAGEEVFRPVWKATMKFVREPIENPIAKQWIKNQEQLRKRK